MPAILPLYQLCFAQVFRAENPVVVCAALDALLFGDYSETIHAGNAPIMPALAEHVAKAGQSPEPMGFADHGLGS